MEGFSAHRNLVSEVFAWTCSVKKVVFKIQNNHRETPVPESLFHLSYRSQVCNSVKKESLVQVFSCEFCKILKNTIFTEHHRTTASVIYSQ